MAHNTQKIAEGIFSVENADWKQRKEWLLSGKKVWEITKTVRIEEDGLIWNVWRDDEDGGRRDFWKVVPRDVGLSKKQIETILSAQPWVCI